jgi:hypothetical protein
MNAPRLLSFAAAAALALAAAARAETLATWSLNNSLAGTTELADALTVGEITAGSAVTSLTLSKNGWNGQGWNSASRNDNAYFQFTVTATDDFYLAPGELAMNFRSTKTGPAKAEVRWSTNGTSWTSAGTYDVPLDGNDKGHPFTADLSAGAGVKVDSGKTLTVRIHAWGASAKTGTFRIGNSYAMTLSGTAIGTKLPPTIVFPNEAETVSLSNTLTVAIGVLPDGSITDWSFAPAPAGTYSLSGKTFTFTPASADVGKTFTLTVTASNSHGASEASLPVAVTEYVPAGAWMTGFETGNNPNNPNAPTNWVIDGRTWSIQQLAFSDKADLPKVGARACVFGSYNPAFMVSADKMLSNAHGCGSVSFLYGEYPGESEPCQPVLVEIATDLASGDWMEVGRVNPAGATTLQKATFDILSREPVHLRIRTEYVNKSARVCIDQLTVLPYALPVRTAFEQYLLDHNVTPGDPGCASETVWAEGEDANSYKTDDFDEDGYPNWTEFNASPRTNPYDKTSHP